MSPDLGSDSFFTQQQLDQLYKPVLATRIRTELVPVSDEPGLVLDEQTGITLVVLPGGRRVPLWGSGWLPPTTPGSSMAPNWPREGAVLTLTASRIPIWRGAKVWPTPD